MQREVTLLNKSNRFVTVKWLVRIAFHIGQCSRTCSTVSWVWHALHWGGLSSFRRYPCVKKVCPISSRWMIISSRRGNRYDVVMITVGLIAWSLFSVLRLHDDYCHGQSWRASLPWVVVLFSFTIDAPKTRRVVTSATSVLARLPEF